MAEQRKRGSGKATGTSRNERNFRGDMQSFNEQEQPPLEGEQLRNQSQNDEPVDNRDYEDSRNTNRSGRSGKMADPGSFKVNTSGWNFKDAQEPYIIRDSKERLVQINDVEPFENEDGQQSVKITYTLPSEPFCNQFTDFLNFPHESNNASQYNRNQWRLGQFVQCFKIEAHDGNDEDINPVMDWPGKQGYVLLRVQTQQGFEDQNKIRRFITNRR